MISRQAITSTFLFCPTNWHTYFIKGVAIMILALDKIYRSDRSVVTEWQRRFIAECAKRTCSDGKNVQALASVIANDQWLTYSRKISLLVNQLVRRYLRIRTREIIDKSTFLLGKIKHHLRISTSKKTHVTFKGALFLVSRNRVNVEAKASF